MTYDSGGLSIKPADFMLTMKMDMAGAGCVLGVFESLGGFATSQHRGSWNCSNC